MSCKISVVMPAFNKGATLRNAVQGVLACKEESVEIIIVDDGSTDGTRDEMAALAKADSRVKPIYHEVNRGAYQARKSGVLATQGDYVMFLDADDELVPGAIDTLLSLEEESPVDILHFGMKVIPECGVDEVKAFKHEQWLTPYNGTFAGREIITACLFDLLYCWNLCGKLFEGDLCRRAFSFCTDGRFLRAEDQAVYLICSFLAETYRGVPAAQLYRYHYGAGGDGSDDLSCEAFERYWGSYPQLVEEFRQFFDRVDIDPELKNLYVRQFEYLLKKDMGETFAAHLAPEARPGALDAFRRIWGDEVAIAQIATGCWEDQRLIAVDSASSELFAKIDPQCKHVAVYYPCLRTQEEAEMVFALASLWADAGSEVTVLLDEAMPSQYAVLFDAFDVQLIQPRFPLTWGDTKSRNSAFAPLLKERHIDTVVYAGWMSHVLVFDLMLLKSLGISTVVHFSGKMARVFKNPRTYFVSHPRIWALCDGMTFDDAPTTVRDTSAASTTAAHVTAAACALTYRNREGIAPAPLTEAIIYSLRAPKAE